MTHHAMRMQTSNKQINDTNNFFLANVHLKISLLKQGLKLMTTYNKCILYVTFLSVCIVVRKTWKKHAKILHIPIMEDYENDKV